MPHTQDISQAIFSQLNTQQGAAVAHVDGPALILAGAGSGKTRVLTARIMNLLQQGVAPWNILAVTFTNKAAGEMRQRIRSRLGPVASDIWIGTFHSIALRILRIECHHIGYESDFVIYDPADGLKVVTKVLKRLNISAQTMPAKKALGIISSLKNSGYRPDDLESASTLDTTVVAPVFREYQKLMLSFNAMDFDDLLLNLKEILYHSSDVLQKYQQKFRYIHVDEYQDTNQVQFEILHLLAGQHRNLFAVGDDDQSIYRFRGATIENILNFEQHYPNTAIFKLEQNYRSPQSILDCANNIISRNPRRHPKQLFSDLGPGEKIGLKVLPSADDEASFIVGEIQQLLSDGFAPSDIAVLYRTNAQSRLFEALLLRRGIPYRVVGSFEFWKRKEIQDVLAYVSLIANPRDIQAFERVVNYPLRGIGAASVEKIVSLAVDSGRPVLEAAALMAADLRGKARQSIENFLEFLASFQGGQDYLISDMIEEIVRKAGIDKDIRNREDEHQAQSRLENIGELISAATAFEKERPAEQITLSHFLEEINLGIETRQNTQEGVSLLTIHSAKGLEFPVVFLSGLENTLFPSPMSMGNQFAQEEERRLMYVAVTRCQEKLFLTRAQSRTMFGKTTFCGESMFLRDIPQELLHKL